MMNIELPITEDLIKLANEHSELRKKIKSILKENKLEFDKFTITNRDSFDGFIAESITLLFIKNLNSFTEEEIKLWEDENPLSDNLKRKIKEYPLKREFDKEELSELKRFFYDRWDIKIKTVQVDVKTAATCYNPNSKWTYAVPKIQIEKEGKDYVFLNYVIYDKDPKSNTDAKPIKCVLVGGISVEFIKKNCPITKTNAYAGHDYQIENYETNLSDYEDIKLILGLMHQEKEDTGGLSNFFQ
jgi:hypothetical protein